MDSTQVREIADATADAAIKRWLLLMGIDASSPQAIKAMQADFIFMRTSRLAGEALKANAIRTFFWLAGTAIVGLVSWLIASLQWKGHP